MPPPDQRADRFRYDGFVIDPSKGVLTCAYSAGGVTFTERYTFGPGGDWSSPPVQAAVRILYLIAGVSYYKTTAAAVIDLGEMVSSAHERTFLTNYYLGGLGEFAFRNGLDLRQLSVVGPDASETECVDYLPAANRPLIPFGGGIDSIVTVDALRAGSPEAALCIVQPPGDTFAAIEGAAAVTALPIVRITREIDPLVRRSGELGFLNGHVPITAVISAAALVAAVRGQRDAVVMSNEWSASVPTLISDGQPVNHQWSKSIEFERSFSELVAGSLGSNIHVFSYLRPRTELWVAQQFSRLTEFHALFRSCNRAFHQNPAQRLDHWCGTCDKCCFIDLILSSFMRADDLRAVFDGHEPLDDPELLGRFETLLALAPDSKPFECVGDTDECRAALLLTAEQPDRATSPLVRKLHTMVTAASDSGRHPPVDLLAPIEPHYIPERYAPPDLLARPR